MTLESDMLAAGLLKRGCYRSGELYLSAIKRWHVGLGHGWTAQMALAFQDAVRSLRRGRGPARQADPIDLDAAVRVNTMAVHAMGCKVGAPVPAVMVASWWMLRELEASTATLGQVSFEGGPGCGSGKLNLPISKADIAALGKKWRSYCCACPSRVCPVLHLKKAVDYATAGRAVLQKEDAPLFPTRAGGFPTKAEMTGAFRCVAVLGGRQEQTHHGALGAGHRGPAHGGGGRC